MLTTIELENFKGFKKTKIEPLRKVNLLIGGQNVGKTSVLEAVYAVTKPDATAGMARAFRPAEENDEVRYVQTVFSSEFQKISVISDGVRFLLAPENGAGTQGFPNTRYGYANNLTLFTSNPNVSPTLNPMVFPIHLPSQNALNNTFGRLVMMRKKKDLLKTLKEVEPRLEDLNDLSPDGYHRIYAELEGVNVALPLPQLGHGFSRLLSLFSELYVNDSKLALIDEIENGIHYSALPTLFKGIKAVAQEQDVQSIITTHSMDCIRAACQVFEDSPNDFQVIRLVRGVGDVEVDIIPADAVSAVLDSDGEIR
ncbi:ATP/GTP-binding protein [Limnohabitans sp. DM1]|uniref:AAA family ATPase n=1 Tax=Limnohabitans sp. DM1 TaxID=1597955 RepID=UPI000B1480A7|nr:AAA family ATPase [Limnohabitans sp. DM1]